MITCSSAQNPPSSNELFEHLVNTIKYYFIYKWFSSIDSKLLSISLDSKLLSTNEPLLRDTMYGNSGELNKGMDSFIIVELIIVYKRGVIILLTFRKGSTSFVTSYNSISINGSEKVNSV